MIRGNENDHTVPFLDAALRELEKLNDLREESILLSRKLMAICRTSIVKIRHLNELLKTEEKLREVINKVNSFLRKCVDEIGYIDESMRASLSPVLQEAVEGISLSRILRGAPVPSHKELLVSPKEYLLGIADAIGEIRRVTLQYLMEEDIAKAQNLISKMEEIYEVLNSAVFPDSLVPIRKKVDLARILIDRTLSEFIVYKASLKLKKGGDCEQRV